MMRRSIIVLTFILIPVLAGTACYRSESTYNNSTISSLETTGKSYFYDSNVTMNRYVTQHAVNCTTCGDVFVNQWETWNSTLNVTEDLYVGGNITTPGNVSADYFVGDGSLLTGVSTTPTTQLPAENITSGTFGANVGSGNFTIPDYLFFSDTDYIHSDNAGGLALCSNNTLDIVSGGFTFKTTSERVPDATFVRFNDKDGNMLVDFAYSDDVNKFATFKFGDPSNTRIGFPELGYFAFLNDYTEFWLGTSSDPTLYFNYYVGDGEYHGTASNPQSVQYFIDNFQFKYAGGTSPNADKIIIDEEFTTRFSCAFGATGDCADMEWRSGINTLGSINFTKTGDDAEGMYFNTNTADITLNPGGSGDVEVFGDLEVSQNATIGSVGNPGCIQIRDTDNAGWTKCTTLNGVMSCSIGTC